MRKRGGEKKLSQLWRFFRFRSIFGRVLWVQILLVCAVTALFYLFINQTYYRQHQEQMIENSFSLMDAVNSEVDSQLLFLQTQLTAFFQTDESTHMMLQDEVLENTAVIDSALEFYQVAQRNELIEKAWLYFPQSGGVITSDKKVYENGSEESAEFAALCQEMGAELQEGDGILMQAEGELYWIQVYPESKTLALACVLLDGAGLQELIAELMEDYEYYVYFDGEAVFADLMRYPKEEELLVYNRQEKEAGKWYGSSEEGDQWLLAAVSETSGLTLVVFLPKVTLIYSLRSSMQAVWPVLLLILGLTLAASLWLVARVSVPFQQFTDSILGPQTAGRSAPTSRSERSYAPKELQLLQNMFQANRQREQEMEDILQEVGDAVTDKMLLSLLKRQETETDRVITALRKVGCSLIQGGRYLVLAADWISEEDEKRPVERELSLMGVRRQALIFWEEKAELYPILGDENQEEGLTLILCYSESTATAQIKAHIQQFQEQLQEGKRKDDFSIKLGIGRVYDSLFNLPDSYEDAKENLREKSYYRPTEQRQPEELEMFQTAFSQVIEEMESRADSMNTRLEAFLSEIESTVACPQDVYKVLMDQLVEKSVSLRIELPESWAEERQKILECEDPQERQELMQHLCRSLSRVFYDAANQDQLRYIESAKRLIEREYADSNLSLQSVSQNCGISVSYLSRLFVKYLPPGFNDYLNRYRVQQAEILLINTEYTVAEIGFKTGFNSSQSFIRVFKKYRGETPGQYRIRVSGR